MSKISIQRDYLKLAYPLDGFLVLTSNTNNSYNGGLLMDLDGMTAYKFKPNGRKIGNDKKDRSILDVEISTKYVFMASSFKKNGEWKTERFFNG